MKPERKKRAIGLHMKPRPGQQSSASLSAVEVQAESILEPVLSRANVEQTSNTLEAEKVQNLDLSEKPIVAAVFEDEKNVASPEVIIDGDFDEVQEPIQASENLISDLMKPAEEIVAENADDLEAAMVLAKGQVVDPQKFSLSGGEVIRANIIYAPPMDGAVHPFLGEQPDGSYKAVVTIGEGYWNAITEWSDADGLTAEEWLSNQLMANVETYGQPAKGR